MFVNDIKFYQKMENKVCLNIATNFIKLRKKILYYDYKKVFSFKKWVFSGLYKKLFFG